MKFFLVLYKDSVCTKVEEFTNRSDANKELHGVLNDPDGGVSGTIYSTLSKVRIKVGDRLPDDGTDEMDFQGLGD